MNYKIKKELIMIISIRKELKSWLLLFVSSLIFSFSVLGQNPHCGIDHFMEQMEQNNPEDYNGMMSAMGDIFDQMVNNPQNESTPTIIPVLVHVIHLGEDVGQGTNISYAQIESAIDNLSDVFSNSSGPGANIDITFCPALRTPENTPFPTINGIEENGVLRASGVGVGGYGSVGITSSNEADIKSLTSANSYDYYNIWVVSEIEGNDGGLGTQGYAYYPGAPPNLDGTVILYNAFGTEGDDLKSYTNLNTTVVHEVGHSFGLYHTFEGDGNNECPFENTCLELAGISVDGDMCCDTPPHVRTPDNLCPDNITNDCINSINDPNGIYDASDISYVHNYMDYARQDCSNQFTECQKNRMTCALHGIRNSLTYSLGCVPSCDFVVSNYTHSGGNDVEINDLYLFEKDVDSGLNAMYSWLLDGEQISTSSEVYHRFTETGQFRVCLDATVNDCTDRYCEVFEVTDPTACEVDLMECEYLYNGNFSDKTFVFNQDVSITNIFSKEDLGICNWEPYNDKTPDYIYFSGIEFLVIGYQDDNTENIVSQAPLELVDGVTYDFYLEYISYQDTETENNHSFLDVYLTTGTDEATSDAELLHNELLNSNSGTYFQSIIQRNFDPNDRESLFFDFVYDESDGNHLMLELNLDIEGNTAIVLTNISISKCCELDPMFSYDGSCTGMYFSPSSGNGDDVIYSWNFGDVFTSNDQYPVHEFLHPGVYDVCLSVKCPEQEELLGQIHCVEINIPENDFCNCGGSNDGVSALQCENGESYEVSACFDIPAGSVSCDGSERPFIFSDNTLITYNDWEPLTPYSGNDEYCVSINMTPDQGGDFEVEGETIYLHVCDENGNRICVSSEVRPVACEECEEVETRVFALCDLDNSTGGVFVYEGTVMLDGEYGDCGLGSSSQTAGLNVAGSNYNSNTNTTTIDFTITTDTNLSGSYEATIALCNSLGQPACHKINIYPISCPDECRQKWDPKYLTCTESSTPGYMTYNFNMMFDNLPMGWCEEGLLGHIDGNGEIAINSFSSTQQMNGNYSVEFDIDIIMPCGTVFGQEYNLYLYGCGFFNLPDCYHFPLIFESCECDGDGDGDGGDGGIGSSMLLPDLELLNEAQKQRFNIYPNPVEETLNLRVLYDWEDIREKELRIDIYETSGRLLMSKPISTRNSKWDVSNIENGVYVVNISNNDMRLKSQMLVIIK